MIKKIFSTELVKGSFILFIMFNIFNFLNFVFHFLMGRMLGPESYGVLAFLMSLVYIYSAPTEAIQNLISRYTSKFSIKKQNRKIKFLMFKSLRRGFKIAFILFLFSIFFAVLLSMFFPISFWLILLTNVFIFVSFSVPVVRGILQGRKKFVFLGTSMIIESVLKLFFAVSFVIFGFKIFGAIGGVLLAMSAGLVSSLYFNKEILDEKKEKTQFIGIKRESVPYFITLLIVLLVFSLDIILANRFFSAEVAGKYSVLSMLGKMIFFGTTGIGKAMFPLTSEKHEKRENSFKLFKKSILIVGSLCIGATLVFLLIPKLLIGVFYGHQYLDMAPYLIYSGLALSFLSLTNLVFLYGLSIKGIRKPYYLLIFLIIEGILLFSFHSTVLEYILAFMVSNIIMFIGSFFFLKK